MKFTPLLIRDGVCQRGELHGPQVTAVDITAHNKGDRVGTFLGIEFWLNAGNGADVQFGTSALSAQDGWR